MKGFFVLLVIFACGLLGAAMVFVDSGVMLDSAVCALAALVCFLAAYQLNTRFLNMDDV